MILYKNYEEIDWEGCLNRKDVDPFLRHLMGGLEGKIANIHCEVYAIRADRYMYPITVTTKNYHDSWVVSPYGQYVISLREEIEQYISSRFFQKIAGIGTDFLGYCLKQVENRIVYVHNFLVSTNLYSEQCPIHIAGVTKLLRKEFPNHAIGFRSLNHRVGQDWINHLTKNQYEPFGSRVIYYWHPEQKLTKNERADHKRDRKTLGKSGYVVNEGLELADAKEIEELYNLLYLEKYSQNNPQYSAQLMYDFKESGAFQFITIKDRNYVAFAGYFMMNKQFAAPFFGWDTRISEKKGIYRMISHVLYQKGIEHQLLMNHSGGASKYKKMRGCKPEMEYTYIYTKHLRLKGRFYWRILRFFTHTIGGKILWKYR